MLVSNVKYSNNCCADWLMLAGFCCAELRTAVSLAGAWFDILAEASYYIIYIYSGSWDSCVPGRQLARARTPRIPLVTARAARASSVDNDDPPTILHPSQSKSQVWNWLSMEFSGHRDVIWGWSPLSATLRWTKPGSDEKSHWRGCLKQDCERSLPMYQTQRFIVDSCFKCSTDSSKAQKVSLALTQVPWKETNNPKMIPSLVTEHILACWFSFIPTRRSCLVITDPMPNDTHELGVWMPPEASCPHT